MRITNSMMRQNVLWSINNNELRMSKYETQRSTGKKIQKPSDDPIVAVRALKLRTNVREIKQYKTNSEDGISWLSVSEQAVSNSISLMQRARELCVKAASDTYTATDRETIAQELTELKNQLLNEGNVNYAGRHVFTGFKTDQPLVFTKQENIHYTINEGLDKSKIETFDRAFGKEIREVNRLRLGYDNINNPQSDTLLAAGFTITSMTSLTAGAYEPAEDEIYFLQDTGELIFNKANLDGTGAIQVPNGFNDFVYDKNTFKKGDLVPEMYFNALKFSGGNSTADFIDIDGQGANLSIDLGGVNQGFKDINIEITQGAIAGANWNGNTLTITLDETDNSISNLDIEALIQGATGAVPVGFDPLGVTVTLNQDIDLVVGNIPAPVSQIVDTGELFLKTDDEMIYQISHNQEITVNTLGNKIFTNDLVRDFDDLIRAVRSIDATDPDEKKVQESLLSEKFGKMITNLDKHIREFVKEEAKIGGKVNRLILTVNRLEDDDINFTNLLSLNEDVNMAEAVLNLQAQQIVYQSSLAASSKLLQQTLLDFVR